MGLVPLVLEIVEELQMGQAAHVIVMHNVLVWAIVVGTFARPVARTSIVPTMIA